MWYVVGVKRSEKDGVTTQVRATKGSHEDYKKPSLNEDAAVKRATKTT